MLDFTNITYLTHIYPQMTFNMQISNVSNLLQIFIEGANDAFKTWCLIFIYLQASPLNFRYRNEMKTYFTQWA